MRLKSDKIINGNVIELDGKHYKVEVMPLTKEDIDNRRTARINLVEQPSIEHINMTFTVAE